GVADDQRVFLPVRHEIVGHLEDFVGVTHASDDGDLVAHHVDQVDGHRLLVDADDCDGGALLRRRQRGVDDGGHTGGVEIDVGARLSGEHALARAVQFDQARHDVLLGGVDGGVGADLQRLFQPAGEQIHDDDMAHTKGFEGQRGAQAYRPRAEYDDLVGRFGTAAIDAVARDGHRLVERG